MMIDDIDKTEYLASGHRACAGCGATIAARLALKALGKNTVAVSATGCLEVITSPYPETSWEIPWIHVAFENAPAVASGVEEALKAQAVASYTYFSRLRDLISGLIFYNTVDIDSQILSWFDDTVTPDSLFENITTENYVFKSKFLDKRILIPKGSKVIKAFKHFFNSKELLSYV